MEISSLTCAKTEGSLHGFLIPSRVSAIKILLVRVYYDEIDNMGLMPSTEYIQSLIASSVDIPCSLDKVAHDGFPPSPDHTFP
jgi:hypothetical protein